MCVVRTPPLIRPDNVHIAPDLVATGASGPGSPYWMPLWTAQFLPRSFIQSMICTSLCHRILQSSDAPPSEQAALARRFQKHRGHALRTLTEDLAQREHQTSDVTLSSVLILLLLEAGYPKSSEISRSDNLQLQQSFEPPGWRHHTNGATVMINTKGGLGNLVFSRPYLRHLLRYYTLYVQRRTFQTKPNPLTCTESRSWETQPHPTLKSTRPAAISS